MSAQTETNDDLPSLDFDQLMDIVQHLEQRFERTVFDRMLYAGSHVQPLTIKIPLKKPPSLSYADSLLLVYHSPIVRCEKVVVIDPFYGLKAEDLAQLQETNDESECEVHDMNDEEFAAYFLDKYG